MVEASTVAHATIDAAHRLALAGGSGPGSRAARGRIHARIVAEPMTRARCLVRLFSRRERTAVEFGHRAPKAADEHATVRGRELREEV